VKLFQQQSLRPLGRLFGASRKLLRLPRLCSRENVQDIFGSDREVIADRSRILVANDVSSEVGADSVAKVFDNGLQSAHLSLSSAPRRSGPIRTKNGRLGWIYTCTHTQLCARMT
jgi:hypothetical protein